MVLATVQAVQLQAHLNMASAVHIKVLSGSTKHRDLVEDPSLVTVETLVINALMHEMAKNKLIHTVNWILSAS